MAAVKNKKGTKGPTAQGAKLNEPMSQCLAILHGLMGKAEAAPFAEPVQWKDLGLLDYPQIIRHPMDLGTILANLENGKYTTPEHFAKDVRLVWKNATTYNRPDSEIYLTAERLRKLFDKRIAKVTKTALKRRKDGTIPVVTRYDQTRFANLAASLTCDELGILVDLVQKEAPDALIEGEDDDLEIEVGNIDGSVLYTFISYAEAAIQRRKATKK